MKETKEIVKWFEDLLGVENIVFMYGADNKVFNGDGYDFECLILTRKVLYYDKTNNFISTHSPYGTHWEKRKDVLKLKATENFRWCIEGEDFLSCYKPCNVVCEDYYGNSKLLMCCNEKRVNALYNLIKAFS